MRTWLNANTEYEGFPIYFRRTNVPTAEFPILQPRYPRLLVLTHILTHDGNLGILFTLAGETVEFIVSNAGMEWRFHARFRNSLRLFTVVSLRSNSYI